MSVLEHSRREDSSGRTSRPFGEVLEGGGEVLNRELIFDLTVDVVARSGFVVVSPLMAAFLLGAENGREVDLTCVGVRLFADMERLGFLSGVMSEISAFPSRAASCGCCSLILLLFGGPSMETPDLEVKPMDEVGSEVRRFSPACRCRLFGAEDASL